MLVKALQNATMLESIDNRLDLEILFIECRFMQQRPDRPLSRLFCLCPGLASDQRYGYQRV